MMYVKPAAALVVWTILQSCSSNDPTDAPTIRETSAMDTYVSITIYDRDVLPAQQEQLITLAFEEVRRIEHLMTDYNDSSDIGRVNLGAGRDSARVSADTRELVLRAKDFSRVTSGAFDITVGPLVREWNFTSSDPVVPSQRRLEELLPLIDYNAITVYRQHISLKKKGMRLDLGGIAKGFAVDRMATILQQGGLNRFVVDIGGNLKVVWDTLSMFDSSVAEILVRHPRREGEFFGLLKCATAGIATSGDYQRYFISNDVRYHHLIDPSTGYPVQEVVSVTVVAEDAVTGDALSTAVFVLGKHRGMDLVNSLRRVEALIVYDSLGTLSYILSSGLKGNFERTELHD